MGEAIGRKHAKFYGSINNVKHRLFFLSDMDLILITIT